jgi:hypothetical protein
MVYNTSTYLKLNNYGYSDENIEKVKTYLRTRILPDSIDNSDKKKRFLSKWEKDFKIVNDKLVYIPLNLIVIPDDKRNDILLKIYKDLKQGVGQGIDMFYNRVRDKYLNIRRKDVGEFLKSQKVYQITRPQNHIENKPILATSPNERWALDCINMVSYASSNGGVDRGTKFILTVVDYFSRKVWLRPLQNQTAIIVRNALRSVVEESKTYPKIIQADNGSEFKGETSEWMKEHDIVYIKTLSYSPESNGLVEGKNKIVRKILREIMIRQNSRNWTNHLQTCAELMNTQRNGTTKSNPNDIWKEGHELQGEKNQNVIRLHERRISNAIKNNTTEEYKVNDFVRVKMATLYSSVRKIIKSGDKKLLAVNYSPTLYQIKSILKKDIKDRTVGDNVISFEKKRYTLKNIDGTPVQTQLKKNNPNAIRKEKRFFASDMQLVKNPDQGGTYLENFNVKDAIKLNKIDPRNAVAVERALPRPAPIIRAVLPLPVPVVPVPVILVPENYIGKELENTFAGFGRRLFIGKIMSYDKENKKFLVKYDDNYNQEYTLAEIKKYLKREQVQNVRPQRDRRQVVIGGNIHYL